MNDAHRAGANRLQNKQTSHPTFPATEPLSLRQLRKGGRNCTFQGTFDKKELPINTQLACNLLLICPREEWCLNSGRAIATAIRSWRRNERRRRSLRLRALPGGGGGGGG